MLVKPSYTVHCTYCARNQTTKANREVLLPQAQRCTRRRESFSDREGVPVTVITYQCMSTCFLSVVITMSEQVVPSAVAQSITVKFLTNGNVNLLRV